MRFQLKVALSCLVSFISIQHILCDELSGNTGVNNWTCICSSSHQENQNFVFPNNCSSSCDCSPDVGNKWICICDADRFPKVAANNPDTRCFTACDCNSGSSSDGPPPKKEFSGKIIVIMLLICVVITAIASIVSFSCYVQKTKNCTVQRSLFSSDKISSFNSSTNLINHKSASIIPEYSFCITSPEKNSAGCILFRRKPQTIHGRITQFTYTELEYATNKFSDSNLIGLGGSSHVYYGNLNDGRAVAVKRIRALSGPDAESVFATEIELIARLHHCHVVPLLGYCSEYQGKHAEKLLVFEYMANGNLRECLDAGSGKSMDWVTRVSIALGAARGLEYLHEAAAPRILHRDVKSTNILLDEKWRAKITDLGMAKRLKNDGGIPSCSNSPARMQGTFGYFAPEYAIIGRASLKSDVFSFGVVLLELISGRHPIHKSDDKKEQSLVIWAMPILQNSRRVMSELPDPLLEGKFPEEEMQIMAYLAKECLLVDPDSRPTMSEVVQILSTIFADKSRRRNFQLNLFQGQNQAGSDDLKRTASEKGPPRCSLPLNVDRNLCLEKRYRESSDIPSEAEYVDRIVLLTSNARSSTSGSSNSCRTKQDEGSDLTEPRFESFHVATVRTPF